MDIVRWLITMVTSKIGYQTANLVEIHGLRPMVEPAPLLAIQESELAAKDSPKSHARLITMATLKLGLMTASQEEIHSFKLMDKPVLVDPIQVLVSNAKDLIRRRRKNWLSMMVTNKTGLISAIQHRTHGLRRTQAVLVHSRMRRPVDHSQELVLNAKVSPKKLASPDMTVTLKLGLMIANQVEIHLFKKMDKPVQADHTQELVLSAKGSTRRSI